MSLTQITYVSRAQIPGGHEADALAAILTASQHNNGQVGITGYLVDGVDDAVASVAQAGSLDRKEIRKQTITRFGRDRMADEYLAAYAQLLDEDG